MQRNLSLLVVCSLMFLTGCGDPKKAKTPAKKPAVTAHKVGHKKAEKKETPGKKSKKEKNKMVARASSIYNSPESDFFNTEEFDQVALSEEELGGLDGLIPGQDFMPDTSTSDRDDEFDVAGDVDAETVRKEIDDLVSLWKNEHENGLTVDFKAIYYDQNQEDLSSDQQSVLEENIALAQQAARENKQIFIEAYAGEGEEEEERIALAQKRADAIAESFVKAGVPASLITASGVDAQEYLVASSDDDEEQAEVAQLSRRVDIVAA